MTEPKAAVSKRKLFSAIKAAIWGGLLFAGIYLVVIAIDQYVGGPTFPGMIVSVLPELLRAALGSSQPPAESFQQVLVFEALANGFFGASIFFVAALIFQFSLKEKHDD